MTPRRWLFRATELGPELIHEGASAIYALVPELSLGIHEGRLSLQGAAAGIIPASLMGQPS